MNKQRLNKYKGFFKGIFRVFKNLDKKMFKLDKELNEFSKKVDGKLEEIATQSNNRSEEEIKEMKKSYLQKLSKICEKLIKSNEKRTKDNLFQTILGIIKYCIVSIIIFICSKDIIIGIIDKELKKSFKDVVGSVAIAIILVVIFGMLYWMVKRDYENREMKYSLRKFVIDLKIEQLNEKDKDNLSPRNSLGE